MGSIKARLIILNTLWIILLYTALSLVAYGVSRNSAVAIMDEGLRRQAIEVGRGPLPGQNPPGEAPPPFWEEPRGPGDGRGGQQPMRGPRQGAPQGEINQGPNQPQPGMPGQFLAAGPPPRNLANLNAEARRLGEIRRPRLIGRNGKVLAPVDVTASWDDDLFKESLDGKVSTRTIASDGKLLRIASAPAKRDGQIIAVVQVAQDTEGIELAAQSLGRTLVILFPFAVILSTGAAFLLVNSSLRPMARATEEAAHIAATGDMSRRLPVTGGDEMSRLTGALNTMLDKIALSLEEEKTARRELEGALAVQKRFAGDASHELRTPLTRLSLAAENGLASEDGEGKTKALESIKRSAQEMTRLVQQLLLLARADAGQLRLDLVKVDLSSITLEALEDCGLAEDPRIEVAFPEGPAVAAGDRDSVKRILTNLLTNAARHTPQEGSIRISCRIGEGRCILAVSDSGEGIPPHALARLGERFYRVEESRTRHGGGTGLGLALCRELAKAMRATFSAVSAPGEGATFTLGLLLPESLSSQVPHTEIA